MSKAILVMGMPNMCAFCPFHDFTENAIPYCKRIDKKVDNFDKRPNWCPLREVPQKKQIEIVEEDYDGGYSHGFTQGYNACIDEILKGAEENG